MRSMSTFSRCCQFACLALLLAGAGARVSAANILYSSTTGSIDTNNAATIGLEFTPSVDLTVTELGVLDGGVDGPGISIAHDIGLWTDTGTLLSSATVNTTGGTLQYGYRFVPVTPVVLSAGQTYVLAAYYPAGFGGDKLSVTVPPIVNPYPLVDVSMTPRAAGGSALAFPVPVIPFDFRLCANMLFTLNTSQTGDGDLNFDGKVDAADVGLATRMVLGDLIPGSNQVVAGDIAPYVAGASQPDNEITLADLLLILRTALGTFTP